jgi:hypothetical protein
MQKYLGNIKLKLSLLFKMPHKIAMFGPSAVAHICNPIYLGDRE